LTLWLFNDLGVSTNYQVWQLGAFVSKVQTLHLTCYTSPFSSNIDFAHGSLVVQVSWNFLDLSYNLHFFLCSFFLAISNSIPKAESRLYTKHLNPRFREANNANYENDVPTVNS
jgi:hypothetical protein